MAVSDLQHLKNTEVPTWVVLRLRQYVDQMGGKKLFMERFGISQSYMSMLWNGKRHPPEMLLPALKLRLVVQPITYEDIE